MIGFINDNFKKGHTRMYKYLLGGILLFYFVVIVGGYLKESFMSCIKNLTGKDKEDE